MNDSWKRDEREVARRLGGTRVALSGGRGAASRADVLLPGWFIEVKRRQFFRGAGWLEMTRLKATREDRRGVVVVHVARSVGWIVLLSLADFQELLGVDLVTAVESDG